MSDKWSRHDLRLVDVKWSSGSGNVEDWFEATIYVPQKDMNVLTHFVVREDEQFIQVSPTLARMGGDLEQLIKGYVLLVCVAIHDSVSFFDTKRKT